MAQQVVSATTAKVKTAAIVAAVLAPVAGYVSTLAVYLLNGAMFHCWVDAVQASAGASAVAAAWVCDASQHLPDKIAAAVEGIITGVLTGGGTIIAGRMQTPAAQDQVVEGDK